ncbi:MAG TPA: DUF983 domain-containing protein [Bacteroidetes bacterium]|nr:DUF983 domain-containing protein [Bacteroidota bacterium]
MDNTVNQDAKEIPSMMNAIMKGHCPECRKGAFFRYPLFKWTTGFLDSHKNCPHCGLKYEVEPGFFWGSMYINYAFNVATIAAVAIFVYVLIRPESIWAYIIPIISSVVVSVPPSTRFARMIWVHVFGPFKFDKNKYFSPAQRP